MTTPAERYLDLVGEHDDPALMRLIADLDQALWTSAPPELHFALQQTVDQLVGKQPARVKPPMISRKDALKASAVGAAWLWTLGQPPTAMASALARAAALDTPMTSARLYERRGLATLEMEERNARIAAESRTRPVREVLADSR